jgi:hypothetical protein
MDATFYVSMSFHIHPLPTISLSLAAAAAAVFYMNISQCANVKENLK